MAVACITPEASLELSARADELGLSVRDVDVEWEDIREVIAESADELGVGQIVAGQAFSLQEAMCSVELMDPKMDISLGADKVLLLAEVMHLKKLPDASRLDASMQLYLIDHWIVSEVLYFRGHSLVQTLLTSYYLQDLSLLKGNAVLYAFACTLMRRCAIVRDCICRARNYANESFSHFSFGFEIDTSLNDGKVVSLAQQQMRVLQSMPDEVSEALLARLKWSCALLSAHQHFEKANGAGLSEALEQLEAARSCFPGISATGSLAVSPLDEDPSCRICEPELIRRVSPTSAPRILNYPDVSACMATHADIIEQLWGVASVSHGLRTWREAKFALLALASADASLIARSRLFNLICAGHRFLNARTEDVIIGDMINTFGIPKFYVEADYKSLSFHLSMVSVCLVEYLRCLAYDRPRTRRILVRISESWATLLAADNMLDMKVHSVLNRREPNGRYFYCWHLDRLYTMNIEYLSLGFDLALYEHDEMPMIWWYLDHVTRSQFDHHQQFLKHVYTLRQNKLNAFRKRVKKPATPPRPDDVNIPPSWYSLELEIRHLLTRAIFRYIAALDRIGCLPSPRIKLGPYETQYRARVGIFPKLIQAPFLDFQRFQDSYLTPLSQSADLSIRSLLLNANKLFLHTQRVIKALLNYRATHDAPSLPDKSLLDEARKMAIVSISNGIHVQRLLSDDSLDSLRPNPSSVSFQFGVHDHYPIISLAGITD